MIESNQIRLLYQRMLEDCKKTFLAPSSENIEHVIVHTAWLLDLYTLGNVFMSRAKHIILITGIHHTRLIQRAMADLEMFDNIISSPLFNNSFQQCIPFPYRGMTPSFDFTEMLFLDVHPTKPEVVPVYRLRNKKNSKKSKQKAKK